MATVNSASRSTPNSQGRVQAPTRTCLRSATSPGVSLEEEGDDDEEGPSLPCSGTAEAAEAEAWSSWESACCTYVVWEGGRHASGFGVGFQGGFIAYRRAGARTIYLSYCIPSNPKA